MNEKLLRMMGYMDEEGGGQGDGGAGGAGGSDPGEGGDDKLSELQAKLDAANEETARLAAKVSEANKHAKNAERKRAEEQRTKDEEEGNYKQLFESSESERKKLLEEKEMLVNANASEKVSSEALKIAIEAGAEGHNAKLLSVFIEKRLKFDEGSVKVTDDKGNLTISTAQDLANEFKVSDQYASLISGSKASGGGASGGSNGSGATKTITRSEFDKRSPMDKQKFIKSGGKVVNE